MAQGCYAALIGEALPLAPGSRVLPAEMCVASRWRVNLPWKSQHNVARVPAESLQQLGVAVNRT
jgi:hypothetical protein